MSVNGDVRVDPVNIRGDINVALRGEDGLSAYEVAVKNGFSGTEEEWLESLKGEAAKAEAYTNEAKEYWQNAQASAIQSGNSAVEAARYRNEAQDIRDAFAPEVADARAAIQAEKEEAEQKKLLVDDAAANAHLDREQADADAAEVRHLHGDTIIQKNVATDAAERARLYAEGASTAGYEAAQQALTTKLDVDGTAVNSEKVNGLTVETAVPANAVFTDTTYDALSASEAETGTATTSRTITAKVLADYVAGVVAGAVATLVNSSPATLDTLKELADALGDDPNFATTMTTALAGKLGKSETAVNAEKVNNLTVETAVPSGAVFTDTTYSNATTEAAGLMSADDKTKLNGIASGAQVNSIIGVKGDNEADYRTGNVNITKANIGLGNVDNTADIDKSVASAQTANNVAWSGVTNKPTTLEGYGITNAPTKTGTGASGTWGIDINGNAETVNGLTVETAVPANAKFTDTTYDVMTSSELSDGTSTQGKLIDAHTLATFILTVAADVVNNAPEALDTLAELAQALGDDPNFATTVMNEIGKKLDKSGGVITGNLTVNGTLTGNIVGSASTVNGHTVESDVPANAVFTDTTYSNFVKSGSGAKAGLVPSPGTTAGTTKYLREDGTWQVPPDNNTTYTAASATPLANGTAAVGTSAKYAREDHVHPLQTSVSGSSGSCTGNSDTATKLATARTINIQDSSATNTGTGASFDGSGNATIKLPATIKANITGNCTGSSGSCTGNAATATKATGDKNGNDITTTYANLTGAQTISGVKTFTGKPILTNGITMRVTDTNSTTTRDSQVLYANSSNTANGINVAFGSGGNAVVGGGESYTAQLNALAGNSSEDLYLTSDGNIYLKPNAQTFANAKTITLNTAGELSGLAKVTATAFAGALTGNVTGNCSGSSGSCTGNAANVTGTVAIAHGGTEATTRLGALKNLTNENVGTGSQYFLTITSNWGKGGYASVADVKSVLGIKNFVKSGSTAEAGLVPAPSTTAGTTHYLREDGTWTVPPNTTYSNFVKSGSGAKAGLVPAPSTTAGTTHYLREDGTWQVPPNTNTDTLMTQNVSSGNATYPVLLCPTANATASQGAKTGIFSAKAVLNASNGQMKLNSKVVPVVSSFNSTTGVLALVPSGS